MRSQDIPNDQRQTFLDDFSKRHVSEPPFPQVYGA